jgi:molybdopterin synthase sulfur carrier subunit
MATVVIPALLRKYTGGRERVEARGRNVGAIVDDLERQFPGFRQHLVEGGDLKASIAVSIDGEMGTAGLLDPVSETSEVHFLPALGGGVAPASWTARPGRGGFGANITHQPEVRQTRRPALQLKRR